jgi:PIN domain nuclease of toxin-antitoxin system
MRLLIDTQIYLWWLADSRKLSKDARQLIQVADEVFVSAASIWESEQKQSRGLLEASIDELARAIVTCGFVELPVRAKHAAAAHGLPCPAGIDALDRLLLAQATSEPLRFLTSNIALASMSDLVIVN